jgi:hypothetical protein
MCLIYSTPGTGLSLMAFEKMAQYPSDRQSRDKIFGEDKAWISERMMRKMDGAFKKACRGSEVPLRAFWREMGVRLRMGPVSKYKIRFIGAPNESPDFHGAQLNCDAFARMLKLIYLNR